MRSAGPCSDCFCGLPLLALWQPMRPAITRSRLPRCPTRRRRFRPWNCPALGPVSAGPAAAASRRYANVPDDWDGPSGKNILWKTPVPLPGNSSPVIVAGRIFLTGADQKQRQVYCFDAADGKLLWQADVPSTPESSKLELTDSIARRRASRPARWPRTAVTWRPSSPTATWRPTILNGKLAWSKNLGIPENPYGHAASLAVYKDLLLVPFDQGLVKEKKSMLRAIDIATGRGFGQQPRRCGARGRRRSWSARPAATS